MPRVIVTRPRAQADRWVDDLTARGIDAVALPLIEIVQADPAPLRAAWSRLPSRRLVMFVSANAVNGFFAQRPSTSAWPEATIAAATGPGTVAALRTQGVPVAAIIAPAINAPQLDSEALWQRLRGHDWLGMQALIVRGDGGREWLAERLLEAGAKVEAVAAYGRAVPRPSTSERAMLATVQAQPDLHAWLFSSAEAIANLVALGGAPSVGARAIATHPRIAERARQAGFTSVEEVSPRLADVVALLQSLRP